MRYTTHAGIALLIIAAMMLVASSGAFESVEADRGVSVQTVSDEEAYLGLEYDEEVELHPSDAEECSSILYGLGCNSYEVTLLSISDQTGANNLHVVTVFDESIVQEDFWQNPPTATIAEAGSDIIGTFHCRNSWRGQQISGEVDIPISIEATSDQISIDATREITVQCA